MKLSPQKKRKPLSSTIRGVVALFGTGITVITLAGCMKLAGDQVAPLPENVDTTDQTDSTDIEDNDDSTLIHTV